MEYTYKVLKHKKIDIFGIIECEANLLTNGDTQYDGEILQSSTPRLYTTECEVDALRKYYTKYPTILEQLNDYDLLTVKMII